MNNGTIDLAAIEEWINNDLSEKTVKTNLLSKGYPPTVAEECLIEFKRLRRAKNYSFALMILTFCLQAGLVACFVAMHKS